MLHQDNGEREPIGKQPTIEKEKGSHPGTNEKRSVHLPPLLPDPEPQEEQGPIESNVTWHPPHRWKQGPYDTRGGWIVRRSRHIRIMSSVEGQEAPIPPPFRTVELRNKVDPTRSQEWNQRHRQEGKEGPKDRTQPYPQPRSKTVSTHSHADHQERTKKQKATQCIKKKNGTDRSCRHARNTVHDKQSTTWKRSATTKREWIEKRQKAIAQVGMEVGH